MAWPQPAGIGEWLHTTVRLGLIAVAVALLNITVYTAVLSHEAAYGILITGISIHGTTAIERMAFIANDTTVPHLYSRRCGEHTPLQRQVARPST